MNGSVRFVFDDEQSQEFLADYELDGVGLGLTLKSRKEFAQIYGSIDSFTFNSQKINKQGKVKLDIREILKDDSQACVDYKDDVNSKYLMDEAARANRYKKVKNFFFEEMELKVVDGLIYFGASFDDLYLGKPQTWHA